MMQVRAIVLLFLLPCLSASPVSLEDGKQNVRYVEDDNVPAHLRFTTALQEALRNVSVRITGASQRRRSTLPSGRRLFVLPANPAVPGIKGVPGVLQRAAPEVVTGTDADGIGLPTMAEEVMDREESKEIQADKEVSRDVKQSKRKKIWGKIQKKYKQAKKKTKQWEQDLQHKKQDMKRRSQHMQKDGQQEAPELKELLVLPEKGDEVLLEKDDELVNKDNQWQEKVAKTPVTV